MLCLVLAVSAFFSVSAQAQVPVAERPYEEFGVFLVDRTNPEVIYLNGPILSEAILDFRRARRAYPDAHILVLNSPGGYVSTALAIADEMFEAGFSTVIPSWAGCYSSCAFMFLAGVERLAVGELGVHQFNADEPDLDAAQRLMADVLEILGRFDTPAAVISVMLRTPPEDIYIFTADEIEQYGLNRGFAGGAAAYEPAGDTLPQVAGASPSGASLLVDPDGINQRLIDGTVSWELSEEDGRTALIGTVDLGRGEVTASILISPPLDPAEPLGLVVGIWSDADVLFGGGNGRSVGLWAEDADGEIRATTLGDTEANTDENALFFGSHRRWLALDLALLSEAVTIDFAFTGGSAADAILSIPLDPDGIVVNVVSEWLEQSQDMPLGDPPQNEPRSATLVTINAGAGQPAIEGTVTWYAYTPYLAARVEIPSRDIWLDLSFSNESALMVFYPPDLFAADPFRVALLGASWEAYDPGVFVAPLDDSQAYLDSATSIDVMLRLRSGEVLVVTLPRNSEFAARLAEVERSWTVAAEPAPTPQIVDAPNIELETRIAAADIQAGQATAAQCLACHTMSQGAGVRIGPNLYDIVGAPVARSDTFRYSPGLEALHAAGAVWTVEQLDFFLAGPSIAVPGTAMTHPGFANSQDRAKVIAYLRSLSPNPVELVASPPEPEMPDWRLAPTFGELKLVTGFRPDPHRVSVQSGGPIDAAGALGGRCAGFIAEAPDFRLFYEPGDYPLIISVDAEADTTIVVNDPNGDWFCDDDSGPGVNPLIRWGNPVGGQYDIWIGTYADETIYDATLLISEVDARPLEAGNDATVPADDTGRPQPWEDSQFVASYQDWTVFIDGDSCFVASLAVSAEPDNPAIDPTYVIVLDYPASDDGPQMAFLFGYNLDGRYYALAAVDGGRTYNLIADAGDAFVDDLSEEPALVADMQRGLEMVLTGRASGGTIRSDVFSLLGFTAALQRARAECSG